MAITKIQTRALVAAVTDDITANSAKTGITSGQASAITANTAKVTNSTSASDLTSGTLPDARFPSTLPAISGSALTGIDAVVTGTSLPSQSQLQQVYFIKQIPMSYTLVMAHNGNLYLMLPQPQQVAL
jgi:pyridoxal/pyridoxine/pyridoxamine kinase